MDFLKCRLCNIKELPKKTKDRTDNTLYIYKGEPRLWKNNYLSCCHNTRPSRCKECNLEGYKKSIEMAKKQRIKHDIKKKYKEYYQNSKEHRKEYYQKNKEKLCQQHREYCKKNKVIVRINAWIQSGFKHTDEEFKEIFKRRQESIKCELCDTEYTSSRDKHADHHHSSGSFRNICCNKCNNNRRSIDRKMDKVLLELHRYFLIN